MCRDNARIMKVPIEDENLPLRLARKKKEWAALHYLVEG